MRVLRPLSAAAVSLSAATSLQLTTAAAAPPPPPPLCWTAETPDAMVANLKRRAVSEKASEESRLAAMALIESIAEDASHGAALAAFREIAATTTLPPDIALEASLLAQKNDDSEGTTAGTLADAALGVLTQVSLLGPFRDTGRGLHAHDGPEGGEPFFLRSRQYGWGAFQVVWRAAPRAFATATGVPLDLFISPRKETCSWVGARIDVARAEPVTVRVASTGAVRLVIDGTTTAEDEDAHPGAIFDRMAVQFEATAGPHRIALKVCTGSIDDAGRVRLRLTGADDRPLALTSSADMTGLARRPLRWKRVRTPLERALAAHRSGGRSDDSELAVAILQGIAGADDAHNPKAHGLLSQLALRPLPLSPDRLAIAATTTPSGAERSAWLARVVEQGARGECPGAVPFAVRRQIESRTQRGDTEWAFETLRRSGATTKGDDDALRLRASALRAQNRHDTTLAATELLAGAAFSHPQTVSTRLLRELEALGANLDANRGATLRDLLFARGVFAPLAIASASRAGLKSVESLTEAAIQRGAFSDAHALAQAADMTAEVGAHEAARHLYETLTAWAPNRAEAFTGLAREIALTATQPIDRDARIAALRRAKELAPTDAKVALTLSLLAGGKKGEEADDSRYIVPSKAILDRRLGVKPGTPTEIDRELYWLRAVVLHRDHRVSELVQYAREIVVPPPTRAELVESIPAEGDDLEIVRALLHRRDGSVAAPLRIDTDSSPPHVEWPELEAGDTVEVVFRSWTAQPVGAAGDAPFYRIDYVGATSTHPVLYNEIVLDDSPDTPLAFDVVHGAPERTADESREGHRVRRLIWDHPSNVADEPMAPPTSENVPLVVVSTFASWKEFQSWYAEAVRGFATPDDQIRELAKELTRGKRTREEKLRAIFNFVADDIRYVNYVSAEGWLPNRPQQVLARKEGDCDDKAVLLVALLSAVGITTEEVLLQTRLTNEPSVLMTKTSAAPLFDHGIAFLPGPGGGRYLDATSPQARIGHLPAMDARGYVLRPFGAKAEVERLPSGDAADHGSASTWTLTIAKDGAADLVAIERHTGDAAFWLRTYLTEAAGRAEYVESRLIGTQLPTAMLTGPIDFSGELPNGDAEVRYRAHSSGFARREGDTLVIATSRGPTFVSLYAPLPRRTLPVALPPNVAPSHESRTLRFIAPTGYQFAEVPAGGEAPGGRFGKAHVAIDMDHAARVVTLHRDVVFDADAIPVAEYADYRAWLEKVDALVRGELRLVPQTR